MPDREKECSESFSKRENFVKEKNLRAFFVEISVYPQCTYIWKAKIYKCSNICLAT